jgi:hypothetical protein
MKRSAWIILVLFILAVGIYFLIDYRQDKIALTSTETTVDQAEYLIDEPEAVLTSIRLFDQMRNLLVLTRNAEANWEILFPEAGLADQTKVSALESQIGSLMSISAIGSISNLEDFGLAVPAYTIKLEYSNGEIYQLAIGNSTPTNSGYYVQVDRGQVMVVSKYSLDAITGLITLPPYPSTPTPTITLEQPTLSIPLFTITVTTEKPTP